MRTEFYARTKAGAMKGWRLRRPGTREELRWWVRKYAGVMMPERGVCAGHDSPLDYLEYVFFEKGGEVGDTVVWACRGGGKTMVGAVATLLDVLFKPGIQVRILGGSKEQSEKMYTYLCGMVREGFADRVKGAVTAKGFTLKNGSRVEILTQSQKAVRGTRVQKMRCDEVELFDRAVWSAAQLTTRSLLLEGAKDKETGRGGDKGEGVLVRGAVEVFSTMHLPGGLMAELVKGAGAKAEFSGTDGGSGPPKGGTPNGRKVFTWCVWDVVGRCKAERGCGGCELGEWCEGRARGAGGFVPMEDVRAVFGRSSRAAWESEMLCRMPYAENQVFGAFRRETHERVFPAEARVGELVKVDGRALRMEGVIGGIDYGWRRFACVWVALLRDEEGRRVAWVVEEYVRGERELEAHAEAIKGWGSVAGVKLGGCEFYADVAGRQHDSHTGRTSENVLKEAGLKVKSRAMQVEDGLRMVNTLVEPAGKEGGVRLLVDPRCRGVVEAMAGYERKGGVAVKDGVYDHVMDALRYAVAGHEGVGGR